jgi:hypothetical protein
MYPIIFAPIVSPWIFSMIVNILPYGVYSTDIWDINVVYVIYRKLCEIVFEFV